MARGTHSHIPRIFIQVSAVLGYVVSILPLYLYPIATFDPIEGGAFYESAAYRFLYVTYAAVFLFCATALLVGKMKRVFSLILLLSFSVSHFHFKSVFGSAIVFKPAFTIFFIVSPTVIFLLGALAAYQVSSRKNQR